MGRVWYFPRTDEEEAESAFEEPRGCPVTRVCPGRAVSCRSIARIPPKEGGGASDATVLALYAGKGERTGNILFA